MKHTLLTALIVSFAAFAAPAMSEPVKVELSFAKSTLLDKGLKALQRGDLTTAQKSYEAALRSSLSSEQERMAYNQLCVTYYYQGNYESAMESCNKAIRLSRMNWSHYNNRGNIYLAMGQYDLAVKDYERGLEISPNAEPLLRNVELARTQAAKDGLDPGNDLYQQQSPDGEESGVALE